MSPSHNQKPNDVSAIVAAVQAGDVRGAELLARRAIAVRIIKQNPNRFRYWRPCFPWKGGWQFFDTKLCEAEKAQQKLWDEIAYCTSDLLSSLPANIKEKLWHLGDADQSEQIERMLQWKLGWPPAPSRVVPFKDKEHERRDGILVFGLRSIADRLDRLTDKIPGVNTEADALREAFRAETMKICKLADAQESDGHMPDFGHTAWLSDGTVLS